MAHRRRFAVIAVRDVPYPNGLGKTEYPDLHEAMERLLGDAYDDQDTNAHLFWTPPYQDLIATYLAPTFERCGDIAAIAAQTARVAATSTVFDQLMPITADNDPAKDFRAGLPGYDTLAADHGILLRDWIKSPPRIWREGDRRGISDGRHRLSYLRSIVERRDPDFGVLVELDH